MANNTQTNGNNWKVNQTIDQNIRSNEHNCQQTLISSVSSAESSSVRVRPLVEQCLSSVAADKSDNRTSAVLKKLQTNNNSNDSTVIEANNKFINNSSVNLESPKQLIITTTSSADTTKTTTATTTAPVVSPSPSQTTTVRSERSPVRTRSTTPTHGSHISIAKYSSIGSNSQLTLPSITLTDVLLEIKIKSIESTLIPLVNQITTLVNARDKPIKTEKQLRAIVRVGQSVNLSVERFVAVGEAIADDNPEIRAEMCDACKDARAAGTLIEQLCDTTHDDSTQMRSYADKSCMVRAARALLSSVTRVLLIADTVVVKQLISSKDRVSISLNRLENVANFTEFVKAFSQFGSEMVELAHLTGDRQNDLKDERRRAQMSCARQILERSTMMLLTSSKACLRHPDCDTARENRDTVFLQMRKAMDLIHMVIKDGVIPRLAASAATYEPQSRKTVRHGHVSRYAASAGNQAPDWKLEEWDGCITASNAIKRFQDLVEMSRMTFVGQSTRDRLNCALDAVVERTQDFTDSAYTSHEHREKILLLCDRARLELNSLLRLGVCLEQAASNSPSEDFEASIVQTIRASNDLKQELQDTALDQIDELFRMNSSVELVNRMKNFALAGDNDRLDEYCDQFNDYCDRVQEVCRLLHHTSTTETLQVTSKHTEQSLEVYGQQLISAAQTLALHPSSKIAKENLEVFSDVWHLLCADLAQLARDVCELVRGYQLDSTGPYIPKVQRPNTNTSVHNTTQQLVPVIRTPTKTTQSTQPFATSHTTNTMSAQQSAKTPNTSSRYSDDESKPKGQGSDTDMGEEAKYATNDPEDNDIARKAKSMSTMAQSMYQFTRGEGELKTTQDLFTQAEFFADEANKLYKVVRHFTYQVPSGPPKKELLDNLDKVPTFVQQLQFAVKNVTVGKAATFTKVDNVIQETKNLMAVISLVTTNCMACCTKYNMDMQGALRARSRTLSPSLRGDTDVYYEGGGMGTKGGTAASEPDF